MSSNLVIVEKDFSIDSIEDLLDPRAENIHPYVAHAGILEHWIRSSTDTFAVALRNHFKQFGEVYVDHDTLSNRLFDSSLKIKSNKYAVITTDEVNRNTIYKICKSNLYPYIVEAAGCMIYPHLSKKSYYPVCYAYLYNISNVQKEKRFNEL